MRQVEHEMLQSTRRARTNAVKEGKDSNYHTEAEKQEKSGVIAGLATD
jgi:hypothetical protein